MRCKIFIVVMGLGILCCTALSAQTISGDTLFVDDLEWVNDQILNDTTATGDRVANRIYYFERNKQYWWDGYQLSIALADTTWTLRLIGEPNSKGLSMVQEDDPSDVPPIMVYQPDSEGNSVRPFRGTNVAVHFENIVWNCGNTSRSALAHQIFLLGTEEVDHVINNCAFINPLGPTFMFRHSNGYTATLTNNLWAQGLPAQIYNGGVTRCATVCTKYVFENNTLLSTGIGPLFNVQPEYARINHNTLVNLGSEVLTNQHPYKRMIWSNNLHYNNGAALLFTARQHLEQTWTAD